MENRTIKVLLIEDNVDDAELIKLKLEKLLHSKFQVTVAQKLNDGLEQAHKNPPDLILSDLGLPDSHGIDTVTKILLAVPHIPLVVLSGFDDEDIAIKAVQSGAQDYLVKGYIENYQLERAIYYSIERARLSDELEQNAQEISKLHGNLLKILENNADAIIVVGETGHILFTNPAAESIFGRKPKELLYLPFQYPLNTDKTTELEINRADEKITTAETSAVKISWEGSPAYLVSMHDITNRKAMEEALRTSEEKYRNIVEMAQYGIITLNLDGQITACNEAFAKMRGAPKKNIIGKHFSEIPFMTANKIPSYIQMFSSLIRNENFQSIEIEWKHQDGTTKISELRASLMIINGKIVGIQAIIIDVTERKEIEKALIESEEKFSKAFMNSPQAIVITSLDNGVIMDVNDSFLNLTGYNREDLVGKKAIDLDLWNSPEEREEVIKTLNEHGIVKNRERQFCKKSGEMRTWLFSAESIKIYDKPCMLSVTVDITDRKKTEKALAQSEEKYRELINTSTDAIISTDVKMNIIIFNRGAEKIFGYKEKEMLGQSILTIFPPELHKEVAREIVKIKRVGTSKFANKITEAFGLKKNCATVPIEVSLSIRKVDDNFITTMIIRDITMRKEAEEKLRESEERYRDLFENASDLIQSCDSGGKLIYVNQAWRNALGYSKKEVPLLHFQDIIHPDYLSHCQESLKKVFSGETIIGVETGFLSKDKKLIIVEGNVNPERKDGKVIATRAIFRDITIRKEAEEKLQKINQMKSEFLSNVSHELRTPLQSISGFTKLILTGKVPDPAVQQEFLQIIDRETAHLGNLINSLLDMSRLEAGRFQIYRKPVPVSDIFTDSIKMFHSLAREKSITLIETIPANLPKMEVDSERMRQVIINLLGNAIKFSDPGTTVNVNAAVRNGNLLFQVIDHGTGIREKDMAHLFERFFRPEDEKVRGGTGLGLYISKQIIDAHGGRIWAESKFGQGSTFSFTLPLNNTKGGEKNDEKDSDNRRRSRDTKTGRLLVKARGVSGNHSL